MAAMTSTQIQIAKPPDVTKWFNRYGAKCREVTRLPFFYDDYLHQHCDEGIFLKEGRQVRAVATISMSGQCQQAPTVLACYTMPKHRRKGYGKMVCEAAMRRLLQRGARVIHVTLKTDEGRALLNAMPDDLRAVCKVQ
jgi:GNAT superfamily N-acetyltransferase